MSVSNFVGKKIVNKFVSMLKMLYICTEYINLLTLSNIQKKYYSKSQ
jgi:hypothetical protein